MSLILSGPKRIYVLLLFWHRLADPCATCPRSLVRAGQALGADDPKADGSGCIRFCRVVMACRIFRVFWRRLIGLSLLVFELPPSHGQGASSGQPRGVTSLSERRDADFP
jgi:hypothetical protein